MNVKPLIVVVDDEPDELGPLHEALDGRYHADYEVVSGTSATEVLGMLERARDAGTPVALVIADQWMPEMTGVELLDRAHALHPEAQRGLLVEWGDKKAGPSILEGCSLGHLENYLHKPWSPPEVHLYPAVGEFLTDWTRLHGPQMELVQVIGEEPSPRTHELLDLLGRSGIPHGYYHAHSERGKALLGKARLGTEQLPVLTLLDGHAMVQPTNAEVLGALGATEIENTSCDVAIVGGGPAGLAAAVYASSEGLGTILIEREVVGGQAGTSSLIRNYLGFPRGISGAELAQRAYEQAWLFGTKYVFAREATGLRAHGSERAVSLSDGMEIRAKAILIATGATYRRLGVPSLERFSGAGIYYSAPADARLLRGQEAIVVGGGNSAGQAVVHLATNDCKVTYLVRSGSLEKSMSDYLVQEIRRLPNVDLRLGAELVAGKGDGMLEQVTIRDRTTDRTETVPATMVFALIGALPHTDWVDGALARNDKGYILTDNELTSAEGWPLRRPPARFETSMPGVFAVGDVRYGSVKRVASAVGEGSVAIRFVHDYLASLDAHGGTLVLDRGAGSHAQAVEAKQQVVDRQDLDL